MNWTISKFLRHNARDILTKLIDDVISVGDEIKVEIKTKRGERAEVENGSLSISDHPDLK